MQLIDCNITHSDAILAIFNETILNSTALYDYKPRMPEMMQTWFQTKRNGNFPILGILTETGELAGFASYGTFRAFPAYKYTVEHSIYIASSHRGKGLGKLLLQNIITRALSQDYHVLVGGIDSSNTASIALHEKFGFKQVAMMPQVGFKFGKWLDLTFYSLILNTPTYPIDG